MRIVALILMIGLSICFGFTQSWADSETEKTALSAAQAWLAVVDGGNYARSWKEASGYFRGAVPEKNWEASMDGFRRPLGKLVSRKIVKTQESTSLPGAPDGSYVVMSFETSFEKKKSAVETVTFMLDKDKKWRAVGYFIK